MEAVGRLRLHYARDIASLPEAFEIEYKPAATVADLESALSEVDWCVHESEDGLSVASDRSVLSKSTRIIDSQLVQGAVLSPGRLGTTPRPRLSDTDRLRVVHADGPQTGFAWPLSEATRWHIVILEGHLRSIEVGKSLFEMTLGAGDSCSIELANGSGLTVWIDGWRQPNAEFSVRQGSVLTIEHESFTVTLRVLAPEEAGRTQSIEGLIRVRPRPNEGDTSVEPLNETLKAPEQPSLRDWDWKEQIAQPAALALAYLLMGVIVGFSPFFLIIIVVPMISVAISARRHGREQGRLIEEYNSQVRSLDRAIGELKRHVDEEAQLAYAANPPLSELAQDVARRAGRFWSTGPASDQYLKVLLGRGRFISPSSIQIEGSRRDAHVSIWEEDVYDTRILDEGPIIWDVGLTSSAFIGPQQSIIRFVGDAVVRLCATHSPDDLTILGLLPNEATVLAEFRWLPLLPHAQSDPILAGYDLVSHGSDVSPVVKAWIDVLTGVDGVEKTPTNQRHRLVMIHEQAIVSSALLERLVFAGHGTVTICWIGSSLSLVPQLIETRVNVLSDDMAADFGFEIYPGGAGALSRAVATQNTILGVAMDMEACVDEGSANAGVGIPLSVPVGALVDPQRNSRNATDSLRAPIGLSRDSVVEVDLVTDGPHLLVGGTTGSGKSELLRTLILGVAGSYSPDEVCLMLIDFKGGASLGDLAGMHGTVSLPHVAGSVTNLGEHDVNRLILFLRAEVLRRQRVLAPFNGEYSRYRKRNNKGLPRLVVVIDEFAGFIESSTSSGGGGSRDSAILEVAARGRSLGVHLVIATQSPKGVVTGQVSANVNARIALRVLDAADSESIIGSPEAGNIANALKGRAYAKFEDGNLVQFQSGFSGAEYLHRQRDALLTVTRLPYSFGEPVKPTVDSRDDSEEGAEIDPAGMIGSADVEQIDDASILVRAIRKRYELLDPPQVPHPVVGFPPGISQPLLAESPLSPTYRRAESTEAPNIREPGQVCIGVRDLPALQESRVPYLLSLHAGAALIHGASTSGRSSALVAAAGDFQAHEQAARTVVIDGARSGLGVECSADWTLTPNEIGNAHHLLRQLDQDYGPMVGPTLLLIDRLDLIADALDLDSWARLFANSGSRRVYILATTDVRLTIEPKLRRAFSTNINALAGYPGVFHEQDDEWSLISTYEVELARKTATPRAGSSTFRENSPVGKRQYFSEQGLRPIGFGHYEGEVYLTAPDTCAIGWDRERHEKVELQVLTGAVVGVAGGRGSGRSECLTWMSQLMASTEGWAVGHVGKSSLVRDLGTWETTDLVARARLLGPSVQGGADLAERVLEELRRNGAPLLVIDGVGEQANRAFRNVIVGRGANPQGWEVVSPAFWAAIWQASRDGRVTILGGGNLQDFLTPLFGWNTAFGRDCIRVNLVPPDVSAAESIPGIMTTRDLQRRYFNSNNVEYGVGSGRMMREDQRETVEIQMFGFEDGTV